MPDDAIDSKDARPDPSADLLARRTREFQVLQRAAETITATLDLEFDHSETEGPVFDAMDMQIEAIASMVGLKGIFKLRAADIYRVLSVTKNVEDRIRA